MTDVKENNNRMGVTHAIRAKLNFLDERLWKRFSARRLELIDTLDLSLRKASEQEDQIRRVAEALRVEFNYTDEYKPDFDKLVRAAVQSVRRNRKRSLRSKRGHDEVKRPRIKDEDDDRERESHDQESNGFHSQSHNHESNGFHSQSYDHESHGFRESHDSHDNETEPDEKQFDSNLFLSEIVKIKADRNVVYDMNYNRAMHFSDSDRAKQAIDTIIKPRMLSPSAPGGRPSAPMTRTTSYTDNASSSPPPLPAVGNLHITNIRDNGMDAFSAKATVINFIERSKSCSESVSNKSDNLQVLGKAVISACIAFLFERSFSGVNQSSIEYLRTKLTSNNFLAKLFRGLDPNTTLELPTEIALISLHTLIGGCVKDFGFESIMFPMCEIFYVLIVQDYPSIAKSLVPFKSGEGRNYQSDSYNYTPASFTPRDADSFEGTNSLSSLAAVATDLHMKEKSDDSDKKKVSLRFLSSVLEFLYPTKNSATPRYIELIENACSAFKLDLNNSMVCLRDVDGTVINGDLDLERIFKTKLQIELEIFTQESKNIAIDQLTSAVIPSHHEHLYPRAKKQTLPRMNRIILPPPIAHRNALLLARGESEVIPHSSHHLHYGGGSTTSSTTDRGTPPPPPPPLLPRFQPLL